jgi:hypothetical protein
VEYLKQRVSVNHVVSQDPVGFLEDVAKTVAIDAKSLRCDTSTTSYAGLHAVATCIRACFQQIALSTEQHYLAGAWRQE